MTYGYCAYHEIECDYYGHCRYCPYNTEEDTEWFKQDEEQAESGGLNVVKDKMLDCSNVDA